MSTFLSRNPARPDDVVGTYPTHTAADVDAAVARAAEAQRAWARRPIPGRADVIAAAGQVLLRDKEALTALVSREAGKVLVEAGGDVQEAVDMAAYVAGQGRGPWGQTVPSELGSKLCWTTRQPVGVGAAHTFKVSSDAAVDAIRALRAGSSTAAGRGRAKSSRRAIRGADAPWRRPAGGRRRAPPRDLRAPSHTTHARVPRVRTAPREPRASPNPGRIRTRAPR